MVLSIRKTAYADWLDRTLMPGFASGLAECGGA